MDLYSWMVSKHNDLLFQVRPWRFDLLDHPEFERKALTDGVKADVLILSAINTFDLPKSVRTWLTQSLAHKKGSNGAIVALFGSKGYHDLADSPRIKFVQSAAKEAGLDFFTPYLPDAGPARAGSIDWFSENDGPTFERDFRASKPPPKSGDND